MSQVPGIDDVQQTPLRNTQDVVPVPASSIIRARVQLADAGLQAIERIADQQNEIALAQADVDAAAQLSEIRQRMLTDNDWQTQPERAGVEARTILETHGQTLRGASTQRAWQLRTSQRLGEFNQQMIGQSRERGADLARADLVALQTRAAELAGDLNQPEDVRRQAVLNFTGALQRANEAGLVTPDWAATTEAQFSQTIRGRTQDALRGEFIERLSMDPVELADDIEDGEGAFRVFDPDERARMVRQAREQGAQNAIDSVLEETLRSGDVVGEDDARLAGAWQYLGDGARLQYAQRAAQAADLNRRARALGDLSGLSLSEIINRADQADDADGGQYSRWAAGVAINALRTNPAAYVLAERPNVTLLRDRASQAIAAANANPNDSAARFRAVQARQQYAVAQIEAQSALGLPSGQIRIHQEEQLAEWVRRVRSRSVEDQQRALDELPRQMAVMYGDPDLASRAAAEHLDAYYRMPQGVTAPAPDPAVAAANGVEYDSVRASALRALRSGSDWDDPVLLRMIEGLSMGDRTRLMQDPEIAAAVGGE